MLLFPSSPIRLPFTSGTHDRPQVEELHPNTHASKQKSFRLWSIQTRHFFLSALPGSLQACFLHPFSTRVPLNSLAAFVFVLSTFLSVCARAQPGRQEATLNISDRGNLMLEMKETQKPDERVGQSRDQPQQEVSATPRREGQRREATGPEPSAWHRSQEAGIRGLVRAYREAEQLPRTPPLNKGRRNVPFSFPLLSSSWVSHWPDPPGGQLRTSACKGRSPIWEGKGQVVSHMVLETSRQGNAHL